MAGRPADRPRCRESEQAGGQTVRRPFAYAITNAQIELPVKRRDPRVVECKPGRPKSPMFKWFQVEQVDLASPFEKEAALLRNACCRTIRRKSEGRGCPTGLQVAPLDCLDPTKFNFLLFRRTEPDRTGVPPNSTEQQCRKPPIELRCDFPT